MAMGAGAVGASGAGAAAIIAEAIKASGAIVRVEGSDFMSILSKGDNPLVVWFGDKTDTTPIPAGGAFEWRGGLLGTAVGTEHDLVVTNDHTATAGAFDIILIGVGA